MGVESLLDLSCRRFCNLVLSWLIEALDHETWNKEYREMFQNPEGYARQAKAPERIKPAVRGQQGSLNLKKVEKVAAEDVDLSAVLGKYGNPVTKRSGDGIQIGPDADGNLSVSGSDPADG